jgi:uncharacterized membrane protein
MENIRNYSKILSHNRTVALVICIFLLGVGLRLYKLNAQSLWTDEIFSYIGASHTISKIFFEPDVNLTIQPLYYSIAHFFVRPIENQEAIFRLPSVVFGSFSIIVFFLIAQNWIGRGGAILSAMMLAISPFHIWYSQEARPYAMLMFAGLLSILFLQKLLNNEENFFWKFGFVISTVSTIYCHTVGIAFIGFLVIYILLIVPRSKWSTWLPIFICILFLIFPALYRNATVPPVVRGSQAWRPFHPLSLPYLIWAFSTGYTFGPTITELHMPDRINILLRSLHLILPIMIFFSTIFLFGAFRFFQKNKPLFFCGILWFLFPLFFTVGGAIFTANEFNVRYTILSFPPFLLFLIKGILDLKLKWAKLASLTIITFLFVISVINHYYNPNYYREDNRGAGNFLISHAATNDIVICSTAYTVKDLKHYSNRNDIKIVRIPMNSLYVKADKLPQAISDLTEGYDQFWLFQSRTFHSDPEGYIPKYFEEHFDKKLEYISSGVKLLLYTKILS